MWIRPVSTASTCSWSVEDVRHCFSSREGMLKVDSKMWFACCSSTLMIRAEISPGKVMDSSFIQVAFRRFLCAGGRKDEAARLFFFLSPRVQVLVQSWSVEARSYGLQQVAIMSTFMASNMHLLARVLPARYATLCVWQWICCGEARLLPAVQQRYQHVDTVVQNSCCYDLNQS